MEDFYQKNKDNPDFATMTVLADVSQIEDLAVWGDFGATYTVLWDVENEMTGIYDVVDRPMFVVVDRDMTIAKRMSNGAGLAESEELVEKLLAD